MHEYTWYDLLGWREGGWAARGYPVFYIFDLTICVYIWYVNTV